MNLRKFTLPNWSTKRLVYGDSILIARILPNNQSIWGSEGRRASYPCLPAARKWKTLFLLFILYFVKSKNLALVYKKPPSLASSFWLQPTMRVHYSFYTLGNLWVHQSCAFSGSQQFKSLPTTTKCQPSYPALGNPLRFDTYLCSQWWLCFVRVEILARVDHECYSRARRPTPREASELSPSMMWPLTKLRVAITAIIWCTRWYSGFGGKGFNMGRWSIWMEGQERAGDLWHSSKIIHTRYRGWSGFNKKSPPLGLRADSFECDVTWLIRGLWLYFRNQIAQK
jgi:hypothetical protein